MFELVPCDLAPLAFQKNHSFGIRNRNEIWTNRTSLREGSSRWCGAQNLRIDTNWENNRMIIQPTEKLYREKIGKKTLEMLVGCAMTRANIDRHFISWVYRTIRLVYMIFLKFSELNTSCIDSLWDINYLSSIVSVGLLFVFLIP